MAIKVGNYTFSAWLRKGIANRITEPDNLGAGASAIKERSNVPIDVLLNGENIHNEFALIGPGDIIGINPQIVVRTEPVNGVANFEPNYLAFIEFYDEDFLWRYTPARANGDKLRPCLALLVLKEGATPATIEFTKNEKRLPLPSVTVKNAAALPPHDQTWAWAHVHTNEGYSTPTDFEKFLLSLHDLNNPNSDKIISRLMSPRKLDHDQSYRAFVVPAFETGRQAGLGQDVSNIGAQQPSWTAGAANIEFPIYYEWSFHAGEDKDFETLVKLLEPRPMDQKVGRRDMDGSKPGFGMKEGTDIGPIDPTEKEQSPLIIGLEGALKSPAMNPRPQSIDTSRPFFSELASILNFPAQVQAASNVRTKDPVVSPPIYGENHAMKHEIDVKAFGWLNELNRDPRNRVPAGFGTNVVQKYQEDYVARAWEQVKKVLDANRRIKFSVFAMTTVQAIQTNFVSRLSAPELFAVFAPVMKKVKGSSTTLYHQLENSNIPPAAVNTALRRMIRPRGAYGKKLRQADSGFSQAALITDLNEGRVSAAPPKQVPESLITDQGLVGKLPSANLPAWVRSLIKYRLVILIILLILLLLLGLLTGAWILCLILAAAAVGAYVYAGRWEHELETGKAIEDPQTLVTDLQNAPPRDGFSFTVSDPVVPIVASGATQVTTASTPPSSPDALQFTNVTMFTPTTGGQDSLEAKNFRSAAISLNERLAVKAPERSLIRFDIANAQRKLSQAIDPFVAFPKLVAAQVVFPFNPGWLFKPEHLIPAMAYPDFPDAMYEKLRDISSELFLPNLQLIPPNTISLLLTNPPFIESYMTGLNHEFGRELLWREYPTDQRGSYFRQFWSVKGIIGEETGPPPPPTPQERADMYKDIDPLDTWPSASALGNHRNKKRPAREQIVLVVRGELLEKYPNTIVFAQKAHIGNGQNVAPDGTEGPVIAEIKTESQMKAEIKFPVFRAEIEPDYRFFGFDLTLAQAKGADKPKLATDDWGWYFIIMQIPGEPRFGMDVEFKPDENPLTPLTWDDLGWNNFNPLLRFINTAVFPTAEPPSPSLFAQMKLRPEREDLRWGRNAADMAFVLYQQPVMIAVHAKEMLENVAG